MRDLYTTIKNIIQIMPGEHREPLNSFLESVACAPPEMLGEWWREVGSYLNDALPANIGEWNEWQRTVYRVWTGRELPHDVG